ncbi:septal ring lytic transglycosylase RlpA family protein [Patescibacteria group bacterium]
MNIKFYTIFIGLILLFIPLSSVFAQEEPVLEEVVETAVFNDVDLGHSEYVALKYLKDRGIINGYADGSFKPGNLINRVEALKMILVANSLINGDYIAANSLGGIDYKTNMELITFTDVFKAQWYYPYLKKAVEMGVIGGYPDGTFKPTQVVNRAESYKMVMESDGLEFLEVLEAPFYDVSIYDWYAKYFNEGKLRQIVYFTMSNTVNPGRELSRSKFAELVYRYLKSKQGAMFGKGSYYADFFEGRGTASGEPYRAAELTAAHRTLPFGTVVKVTNLANGNEVVVRINDRGPYITGRVIDLSKAAFESIAHLGSGVIYVEYEIIESV